MISHMGEKITDPQLIVAMEEQLIERLSSSHELTKYNQEEVRSQIYLSNDWRDNENPSIIITELEDRIEVFRYNLNYSPLRLFFDNLNSYLPNLGLLSKLPPTTFFGIMPKQEYNCLFDFLEQEGVWNIQTRADICDGNHHYLVIHRNQRKHAFAIDSFYNIVHFRSTANKYFPNRSLPLDIIDPDEREASFRFLSISREIYSKSKRYAKTKI